MTRRGEVNRPLRILMLHNRYQRPGGEDVSTRMEVDLLRSGGHSVTLIEESNDRVKSLGLLRTSVRTIWSQEAYRRVDRLLAEGNFDVLHVQNFFQMLSPSVYYAARHHGVPVVQSLRNFRLMCPAAMLYRDGQICEECIGHRFASPGIVHGCYRSSRAATAVVATMSGVHRLAGTWSRAVDLYVTPSEFARAKYVEGGWPASHIVVRPNFVHPDPVPGLGDGRYLLFAGRLSDAKGIPTLLRAWDDVSADIGLRIAGDGPLRDAVEQAAKHDDRIRWVGPQGLGATYELMGDATAVVIPSQVHETFGRVAIEAAAKGTPALVSALGGLPEIVRDGATGWIVPHDDPAGFAARIEWIAGNGSTVRSMRDPVRRAFEARYTGSAALPAMLETYRSAISRSATRRRA